MMNKLLILLLLLLPCLVQASPTAEPAGDLKLVGKARLSVLVWDVYNSSLYTPSGVFQGIQPPLSIRLEYLRDIKSEKLVDTTREQWQKLGLYQAGSENWLSRLAALWPDVASGDTITLRWDADGRSRFFHNDRYLGSVDHPRFGHAFSAIWLSENTEFKKVRKQLIGGKS